MSEAAPALCDGRYKLVSELGVGGMATVYRAYDGRLQVERAIKVLSPELARKRSLRIRFESEASTMALLEHPSIVRVYDVGADGDRIFIVMELVRGGSLLDRVKKHGPLPPRMAVEVTLLMMDALKVAHSRGVIHRDIKPQNVLLSNDGGIRVTDFGIARIQKLDDDGLTKTGSVMGTWGFMAPEQRADAKSVDVRADIYSIGATLYAILTDRTPVDLFAADMDAHMMDGIEPELARVIKKATRYDREERYAWVVDMGADLQAVLAQLDETPAGTPPLVEGSEHLEPSWALGGGTGLLNQSGIAQETIQEALSQGTIVPEDDEDDSVPEQDEPAEEDSPEGSEAEILEPEGEEAVAPGGTDAPRGGVNKTAVLVALLALVLLVAWELSRPGPPQYEPVPRDPVDPVVVEPNGRLETPPEVVDPPPEEPPPEEVPEAGDQVADPSPPETVDSTGVNEAPPLDPPDPPPQAAGLLHTPPRSATMGSNLNFSVELPSPDYQVTVFYRPKGGAYSEKMLFGTGNTFAGPLPIDDRFVEGMEYWIKATPRSDGKPYTFKSGFSPQAVPVR